MKILLFFTSLCVSLHALEIQSFRPLLSPYYREAIPTLFQLQLHSEPPLPSSGTSVLTLNFNGIFYSKLWNFETHPLSEPLTLELCIPPKTRVVYASLQGSLNHTFDPFPLDPPLSSRKILGALSSPSPLHPLSPLLQAASSVYTHPPDPLPSLDFRLWEHFDYFILDYPQDFWSTASPTLYTFFQAWTFWGGNTLVPLEAHSLVEQSLSQKLPQNLFQLPRFHLLWTQLGIEPEKAIFWKDDKPLLLSIPYGKGFFHLLPTSSPLWEIASTLDPQLFSKILPRQSLRSSWIAPHSFRPFQQTPPYPPRYKKSLLGFALLCLLFSGVTVWRKKKKEGYLLLILSLLGASTFYWMWSYPPFYVQELRLYHIAPDGSLGWQHFQHFHVKRSCSYSFPPLSKLILPSLNTLNTLPPWVPQFYSPNDFQDLLHKENKETKNPPQWHFQEGLSLSQVSFSEGWNYVFEQHGFESRFSSRFLKKSGTSLINETPSDFKHVFLKSRQQWSFTNALPSGSQSTVTSYRPEEEKQILGPTPSDPHSSVPLFVSQTLQFLLEQTPSLQGIFATTSPTEPFSEDLIYDALTLWIYPES
jgi:hypothetical protein